MNTITFEGVMPCIFQIEPDFLSEVWGKHIVFEKGKKYLVEAQSGKGKTTLCSYILGHRNDYVGEIFFDGKNIRSLSAKEWGALRRTSLSLLFQELRLFSELTAAENVFIKNDLTHHASEAAIRGMFDELGIADKWNVPVGMMSFGQQQRLALIRALASPFDFLIVDEPISHLDEENANIMAGMIEREVNRKGAGLIVTSIGQRLPLDYDIIYKGL